MKHRDTRDIFMERFLEAIADQGYTAHGFAIEAGIHPATVENWIHKRIVPSGVNLKLICETLYISADYLLGLTDNPSIGGDHGA